MGNLVDHEYIRDLSSIVEYGSSIESRNATTKRMLNLSHTFFETPLVTVRRTAWKNALREFEWFLSGSNNIDDLHPKVHSWWKPWANDFGQVPNNYSNQFKNFSGQGENGRVREIDQVKYMIDTLKSDPGSRRNVITTWNTSEMTDSVTPITNCHGTVIQAFVEPANDTIHLTMYQRSCDMVLGVPHNWIQYWAFLMYLAHKSGRKVGSFHWIGGDCHVYPDHIEAVEEMKKIYRQNSSGLQIQTPNYKIPNLVYNPTSEDFKADDFSLDGKYEPLMKKSLKMTV